jgi:hypothetical protein
MSKYCPISHLSFLSKLTERLVQLRVTDYLTDKNLLNSFPAPYLGFLEARGSCNRGGPLVSQPPYDERGNRKSLFTTCVGVLSRCGYPLSVWMPGAAPWPLLNLALFFQVCIH